LAHDVSHLGGFRFPDCDAESSSRDIAIRDTVAGGSPTAPTKKPLGRLVGAFKTGSTNRLNEIRRTSGSIIRQRSFYEHIIRDERSLQHIVAYIQDNPMRWEADPESPLTLKRGVGHDRRTRLPFVVEAKLAHCFSLAIHSQFTQIDIGAPYSTVEIDWFAKVI
jgi:hypothetical protein